ncbi:MAG: hypothetical protein J5507_00680 [Clostridia bacterium]|nr:hypothetical protein [Clostridia bacterium]
MENTGVNIVQAITETINNLFSNLFSSIDNSLYSTLDDLLFINSDILENKYLDKILGSSTSGLLLICNSLLLGFCIYYGLKLLLSHITFTEVQRPNQFIFKLFLCSISANFSLFIVQIIINLASNLSLAIREVGEIVFNKNICLSTFIQEINSVIYLGNSSLDLFTVAGISKSLISIGLLSLAVSYALRYIMIKVFVFLSPFAFISLINNSTSWIFKSWFKLFISMLVLQIIVPIILLIAFSMDLNSSDIFSKLLYIGTVYSLIKANSYVREFMGGLSTDINIGISGVKNLLK